MNTREHEAVGLAVTAPFEAVHHRFEQLALTYPGATAVRRGGRVLTYGELDSQADALAFQLQRRGLLPGRYCTLRMAPSCALVRAMLAVLKAGGAFLLQAPDLPAEQLAASTRFFDPTVLLAQQPCPDADGTRVLHCAEDAADLPHAWPDAFPVRPRATACALPYQRAPHEFGIAMLTHADLRALGEADGTAPAARVLAPLWVPLMHGAAVTLAA